MSIFQIQKHLQTLQNFFAFIKSPIYLSKSSDSTKDKIRESVILFLLKFLFSIVVASFIGLFYEPQNLTDKSMSERFSPFLYLLIGGLVLPLFEEVLFRLSLVFKPIYLALSTACLSYYLTTKLFFDSRLSLVDDTFIYRISISLIVGCLIYFVLKNQKLKSQLSFIWIKKFNVVYYTSAVIFAWLHLLNFELNFKNILLTPVLTLPQLFSGLVTGYLRVKFGFLYPLIFHILTNSILIGLSIILE